MTIAAVKVSATHLMEINVTKCIYTFNVLNLFRFTLRTLKCNCQHFNFTVIISFKTQVQSKKQKNWCYCPAASDLATIWLFVTQHKIVSVAEKTLTRSAYFFYFLQRLFTELSTIFHHLQQQMEFAQYLIVHAPVLYS